MNDAVSLHSDKNVGFPGFFKFGTPVAIPCHVPGMIRSNIRKEVFMSIFNANNALAAVAAFAISALCMAAAIVPASPAGLFA
ncbi:MAG: hypothetical protein ABGW87_00935 [Sphingomonadaceae bacterium]